MRKDHCTDVIMSEDYIDIMDYGTNENLPTPVCVQKVTDKISIAHFKKEKGCRDSYASLPEAMVKVPNRFGISSEDGRDGEGSKKIKELEGFQYKGQDVLVAIMSTGIDYTHEAFIKEDGTSKIKCIWDQTIQGNPPANIQYGTEYTQEQINKALQSQKPRDVVPVTDQVGQGTFMAGVAVGKRNEKEGFYSIAPEAELVVVKLKQAKKCILEAYFIQDAVVFQSTDVLMAMKYIYQTADELQRPVVIVFGGQSNIGPHINRDVDPIEIYASELGKNQGVVIVSCAGDEADKSHHYAGDYEEEPQVVQFNVSEGEIGAGFSMWVQEPDWYNISLRSPIGSTTGQIGTKSNTVQIYSFLKEGTRLTIDNVYRQRFGGQQGIHVGIEKPTPGVWELTVYGKEVVVGKYNIWMPIESFVKKGTGFLQPSPYTTVVSPATSKSIITIGAYNNMYNSIYTASGRGFTTDNGVKPDVVESGVDVMGPLPGGGYGAKSGTYIAAALAGGDVALLLEWGIVRGKRSTMDTILAKSYLVAKATRRPGINYPSREWGYGVVDIVKSIEEAF